MPAGTYRLSYGTTSGEDVTPVTDLTFRTSDTWQLLTTKYISGAGDVTVQLTPDASGTAIADGMRLVRCSLQISLSLVGARNGHRERGNQARREITLVTVMPCHRKAFSLVELTVVSSMMVVLAVLLSSAWVGVGRTAAGLIGRSLLVQERDLAVAAFSRDLGGCSLEPAVAGGEKLNGRWLKWECPNNDLLPSNQDLKLYYDGGADAGGMPLADTVVRYFVCSDPDPSVTTLILVRRTTVGEDRPPTSP